VSEKLRVLKTKYGMLLIDFTHLSETEISLIKRTRHSDNNEKLRDINLYQFTNKKLASAHLKLIKLGKFIPHKL